jgi:hypothetical protein
MANAKMLTKPEAISTIIYNMFGDLCSSYRQVKKRLDTEKTPKERDVNVIHLISSLWYINQKTDLWIKNMESKREKEMAS